MIKKKSKLFITVCILVSGSFFATKAQTSRRWGIPKVPQNCETNAIDMEQILALMKEEPNPKSKIILIAHLGKQERSQVLNRRRLFNISERYRFTLKVPGEKIIVANGERVDTFGRVEIYWNGELIGALLAPKNADICVDSYNERFYPYKKDSREN